MTFNDNYYATKKRLFEILEASNGNDMASASYDGMILVATAVGLIPLTIKGDNQFTVMIDIYTVIIFLIDYILRVYTSDYKMGYRSYKSYLVHAVMPLMIMDLLSVLPILSILFPTSSYVGMFRLFRVVRLIKVLRYSPTMRVIANIIKNAWRPLSAVFALAMAYIITGALVMFQLEPDLFRSFIDAIYWSGCTVLTIGYGDISPVTSVGRAITVVSSLVGMAIVALPSGIITGAYMDELSKKKKKSKYTL